ncbi:hypothetical protein FACS1894191_1980 [Clostridia bacterium]|nr:hypothetical protein FACS1894191_1980 [Clostridia bacterium]
MSDNDKTIQFIDSNYRELFKIPDGGNINIIYPPGDGRGTITRACKFLDEYHTRIGNYDYHICEFAERMEAIGARYEPVAQLRGAELAPFAPGEEKFFTYNREEGNTCIGHIAGGFGNNGDGFRSSWSGRENGRNTPAFQGELHSAVYALRQGLLKDYDSMRAHCQSHPEAALLSGDNYAVYGFKLETDTRQYFVNCFIGEYMRDAHFIVYAYDKAGPAREYEKPAGGTFEYGGRHFTPVRKFRKGEIDKPLESDSRPWKNDAQYAMRDMRTDFSMKTPDYSYEGFYAASGDKKCDIFRCEENGKLYVPALNELFEYTKPEQSRKAEPRQSVLEALAKAKETLPAPNKSGRAKKRSAPEL